MAIVPADLTHTLGSGPVGQAPPSQQLRQEVPSPAVVPLPTPLQPGGTPAPASPAAVEHGLAEASATYKAGQYAQAVQLGQAVSVRRWASCVQIVRQGLARCGSYCSAVRRSNCSCVVQQSAWPADRLPVSLPSSPRYICSCLRRGTAGRTCCCWWVQRTTSWASIRWAGWLAVGSCSHGGRLSCPSCTGCKGSLRAWLLPVAERSIALSRVPGWLHDEHDSLMSGLVAAQSRRPCHKPAGMHPVQRHGHRAAARPGRGEWLLAQAGAESRAV